MASSYGEISGKSGKKYPPGTFEYYGPPLLFCVMKPFILLVAVNIFLFHVALGQTEADVLRELCLAWRNPNFLSWPADCDGTTACFEPRWSGINCADGEVVSMFVHSCPIRA